MTTITTTAETLDVLSATPSFAGELALQAELARRQLAEARGLGDESLAQVAVARLADLEDVRVLHAADPLGS